MSISIAEVLRNASELLTSAGVPEARKEASALLAHSLGVDRTYLITKSADHLTESSLSKFLQMVERRASGEPAQYITGFQDFYGRTFEVNPDVLIPRPETEGLVDACLKYLSSSSSEFLICDVGTGSGCIAITLLLQCSFCRAVAVDVSTQALEVALRNAETHQVRDRISFVRSDCFQSLSSDLKFDLIVSNPPYVSAKALSGLQREVRMYEPAVALSPGDDGLSIVRRLLTEAPTFLKDGGHLLIEIGFDQSETLTSLVDPTVWRLLDILPDLQQIPRIAVLEKLHDRRD